MAFVHSAKVKDVSIEDFRKVSAKHNPPQDIDGLLAWAAGSDDNGLNVVTIWQSRGAPGAVCGRAAASPRSRSSAWPST